MTVNSTSSSYSCSVMSLEETIIRSAPLPTSPATNSCRTTVVKRVYWDPDADEISTAISELALCWRIPSFVRKKSDSAYANSYSRPSSMMSGSYSSKESTQSPSRNPSKTKSSGAQLSKNQRSIVFDNVSIPTRGAVNCMILNSNSRPL